MTLYVMKLYEYSEAANPFMLPIRPTVHNCTVESGIQVATVTPNLKAMFIKVANNGTISTSSTQASSHVIRVMEGMCTITCEHGKYEMYQGDVLSLPFMKEMFTVASSSCTAFWVNDEPLMKYLGAEPNTATFSAVYYDNAILTDFVKKTMTSKDAQERNRNGVLLSNEHMAKTTKTLTPTLWTLLNYVPPKRSHKPHKHNSVALDLCVSANAKEDCVYTLMGKSLNDDGTIKDPIKMVWKPNSVFVTPPGWWHSHHNESDEEAWVFPVQDAGLHTHMRTLDINFSK